MVGLFDLYEKAKAFTVFWIIDGAVSVNTAAKHFSVDFTIFVDKTHTNNELVRKWSVHRHSLRDEYVASSLG
jgi:hypothetical protein